MRGIFCFFHSYLLCLSKFSYFRLPEILTDMGIVIVSDTQKKYKLSGSSRTHPTPVQEKDVATPNLLQDPIVNAYRPGDIILIAMSQPTNLWSFVHEADGRINS
jgi:hypothetical protein